VVAAYVQGADASSSDSGSGDNGNEPAVTGTGLNWYGSTLTDGAAAYGNPEYYYCLGRPAANFSPFAN
jgi:glucan 1,3-beta-glucosidase